MEKTYGLPACVLRETQTKSSVSNRPITQESPFIRTDTWAREIDRGAQMRELMGRSQRSAPEYVTVDTERIWLERSGGKEEINPRGHGKNPLNWFNMKRSQVDTYTGRERKKPGILSLIPPSNPIEGHIITEKQRPGFVFHDLNGLSDWSRIPIDI